MTLIQNHDQYQHMLLRVFERFNSVSTLLVNLLEYRGHTPSFAEVKNEWSFTSVPDVYLHKGQVYLYLVLLLRTLAEYFF